MGTPGRSCPYVRPWARPAQRKLQAAKVSPGTRLDCPRLGLRQGRVDCPRLYSGADAASHLALRKHWGPLADVSLPPWLPAFSA